jgi:hypothetical protein
MTEVIKHYQILDLPVNLALVPREGRVMQIPLQTMRLRLLRFKNHIFAQLNVAGKWLQSVSNLLFLERHITVLKLLQI